MDLAYYMFFFSGVTLTSVALTGPVSTEGPSAMEYKIAQIIRMNFFRSAGQILSSLQMTNACKITLTLTTGIFGYVSQNSLIVYSVKRNQVSLLYVLSKMFHLPSSTSIKFIKVTFTIISNCY